MPSFGTLKADTLTHSTAGSLATNYVVNGSSKAWVNFDGTGTIAARDSLNLSSLDDDGTGQYGINLTSAMADANYMVSMRLHGDAFTPDNRQSDQAAGAFDINYYNSSGSFRDVDSAGAGVMGDLA